MTRRCLTIAAILSILCVSGALCAEPTVGLVTAFAGEYFAVVDKLQGDTRNVTTTANRLYTIGDLGNVTVVVTICGVGMTNGAMTAQNLMDTFPGIEIYMFSGIAGGVNPANNVGDVVIPEKWAQHHHQKFIRQIEEMGQKVKGFAEFGVDFPFRFYTSHEVPVSFMAPKSDAYCAAPEPTPDMIQTLKETAVAVTNGFAVPIYVDTFRAPTDALERDVPSEFWFYPDEELMAIARNVQKEGIELENSGVDAMGEPFELDPHPTFKIVGAGVSSSTFVDNAEYRRELWEVLGPDCVDMESSAFMHVCASNDKRCLVIRSISDLAGGDAEANVINNFISLASGNSVKVLEKILMQL